MEFSIGWNAEPGQRISMREDVQQGTLMRYSLATLYFDTFRLACDSSVVIGLRMMTLAAGGARAFTEMHLMTSEKMQAAMVVAIDSAFGMAQGRSAESLGRRAISHYHRKVVANRRRLLRRH